MLGGDCGHDVNTELIYGHARCHRFDFGSEPRATVTADPGPPSHELCCPRFRSCTCGQDRKHFAGMNRIAGRRDWGWVV